MKDKIKSLGLTQKQFADLCGVYPETVSKWVTGAKPIPKYAEVILEEKRMN